MDEIDFQFFIFIFFLFTFFLPPHYTLVPFCLPSPLFYKMKKLNRARCVMPGKRWKGFSKSYL